MIMDCFYNQPQEYNIKPKYEKTETDIINSVCGSDRICTNGAGSDFTA